MEDSVSKPKRKPKFTLGCLLVLVALAATGIAYYQFHTSDSFPLPPTKLMERRYFADLHGVRIDTNLNLIDPSEFPTWDRRWNAPPISPAFAIQTANHYRSTVIANDPTIKSNSRPSIWVFKSVELATPSLENEAWVWLVHFYVSEVPGYQFNDNHVSDDAAIVTFVVKMNGEVVPPRIY